MADRKGSKKKFIESARSNRARLLISMERCFKPPFAIYLNLEETIKNGEEEVNEKKWRCEALAAGVRCL